MAGLLNLDLDGELVLNLWWPLQAGGFYAYRAGAPPSPNYVIYAAQSPDGPGNENPATWGGIIGFDVVGGAEPVADPGNPIVNKSLLVDPVSMCYRIKSSEFFITGRNGGGYDHPETSTINRFIYNPVGPTFTPNGTITGNGMVSSQQANFNPVTGELFVANYGDGHGVYGAISRFTFDGSGNAIPNGLLGEGAGNPYRGVICSPDGTQCWATGFVSVHRFALPGGEEILPPFPLAGIDTLNLVYMTILNNELYVAALIDEYIYRVSIGVDNTLTLKETISADNPVGCTFSPDGLTMYVSGFTLEYIDRFLYNAGTDTWDGFHDRTSTGSVIGNLFVISGGIVPGTPVLLARDFNDNIVLTLGVTPNANGDYLQVGAVDFLASNGVTVPAGDYLQLLLSSDTNLKFAGQVLKFNINFTPVSGGWAANGNQQPIPILEGELRFKRDASTPEVYRV